MTIIFLMVFASAFFTDIIGIHPIFGGFIVGVMIPHDNGFAVKITEKIEDLVTTVFLPIVSKIRLYFFLFGPVIILTHTPFSSVCFLIH